MKTLAKWALALTALTSGQKIIEDRDNKITTTTPNFPDLENNPLNNNFNGNVGFGSQNQKQDLIESLEDVSEELIFPGTDLTKNAIQPKRKLAGDTSESKQEKRRKGSQVKSEIKASFGPLLDFSTNSYTFYNEVDQVDTSNSNEVYLKRVSQQDLVTIVKVNEYEQNAQIARGFQIITDTQNQQYAVVAYSSNGIDGSGLTSSVLGIFKLDENLTKQNITITNINTNSLEDLTELSVRKILPGYSSITAPENLSITLPSNTTDYPGQFNITCKGISKVIGVDENGRFAVLGDNFVVPASATETPTVSPTETSTGTVTASETVTAATSETASSTPVVSGTAAVSETTISKTASSTTSKTVSKTPSTTASSTASISYTASKTTAPSPSPSISVTPYDIFLQFNNNGQVGNYSVRYTNDKCYIHSSIPNEFGGVNTKDTTVLTNVTPNSAALVNSDIVIGYNLNSKNGSEVAVFEIPDYGEVQFSDLGQLRNNASLNQIFNSSTSNPVISYSGNDTFQVSALCEGQQCSVGFLISKENGTNIFKINPSPSSSISPSSSSSQSSSSSGSLSSSSSQSPSSNWISGQSFSQSESSSESCNPSLNQQSGSGGDIFSSDNLKVAGATAGIILAAAFTVAACCYYRSKPNNNNTTENRATVPVQGQAAAQAQRQTEPGVELGTVRPATQLNRGNSNSQNSQNSLT